ncbi:hypothetical protein EYF80_065307 [Liparis tanakae]|uniref:Uncharacterized protein n=1 Tax=Liparis tanakae TaxID=230148 RepID=A0A4Z2E731_9TELE|nr:hypothetical protein EYF80_065307 [Liparis tanakae]
MDPVVPEGIIEKKITRISSHSDGAFEDFSFLPPEFGSSRRQRDRPPTFTMITSDGELPGARSIGPGARGPRADDGFSARRLSDDDSAKEYYGSAF